MAWRYVNAHAVVGDGVCVIHKSVAATGLCGNGRGWHPSGYCGGGSAVIGSAAAAAGGGSGSFPLLFLLHFCISNPVDTELHWWIVE